MKIALKSIGVLTHGIENYQQACNFLSTSENYDSLLAKELKLKPLEKLPANERRRLSAHLKLSLNVAMQHKNITNTRVIFASCDGDTNIADKLCTSIATYDKLISPMAFHNSVHNAAIGYLSIALSSNAAMNSISCSYKNMFTTALIEVATKIKIHQKPVLLILADSPINKNITKTKKYPAGALSFLFADINTNNYIKKIRIKMTYKTNKIKRNSIFWQNPAHKAWLFLEQIFYNKKIQNYSYTKTNDLQIIIL
jgi:hypothetical protein